MITEWLHQTLRLWHLIAGIMWIGTSFYFVWLDFSFASASSSGRTMVTMVG